MEAVNQVFFHAPDGSLFLHLPPGLPVFKAFEGLFTTVGRKDQLGFFEAMSSVHLPDFHRHVAHLVSDAALPFHEGVDGFQGLQEAWVAVGDDQLQALAQQPPAFEIGQEALPGLGVFYLSQLEGY